MVLLKSLLLSGIFATEALAIAIHFKIPYYGSGRRSKMRNAWGMTVTDAQAERIKSNMYLWSQGNFITAEENNMLTITYQSSAPSFAATDVVLDNMKAAIQYHVRGPGAPSSE